MAGARHRAGPPLSFAHQKCAPHRIGLLGGSFNPAHAAHRAISLFALKALALDEVWWLVSPGNPLKASASDMAPLRTRCASACALSKRARIRETAIEQRLGTRYTIDTIAALQRRYPKEKFIWLMGADNLKSFHLWAEWRVIASMLPIAVISRPGYSAGVRWSPAALWLRRFVRSADQVKRWTNWSPPALVHVRYPPDPTSATAMRRLRPDWHLAPPPPLLRDALTHRLIREV
ncbi:MAG: nicotinate-nucleotide adenylyltransferase [Alphaproteobacteria bacterium]|nr:nicotinate-nucleotide adenylyltransferase [Alphaproteobacteria bacterium]MDE2341016.1 nicotinate-nucleotide adenylyltransferase [Alphaproteobacteria bacterium]